MSQAVLRFDPRACSQGSTLIASLLMAAMPLGISFPLAAQMRIFVIPPGEPALPGASLPHDSLPDTHVGHGQNDIVQAWLALPTKRYPHGLLGDIIEATAVRVRTRDGTVLSYTLPEDSVFEDLIPRVYDIDRDGRDEVILVKSRRNNGSSLLALGIRDAKLLPIAETESTGLNGEWLNPVGVADVDGDANLELLVVLSPHSNGTLVEYKFDGSRFVAGHKIAGVTNHVAGSRDQELSALLDVNADGKTDVLLPSSDRRFLRAFDFSAGPPIEFARISLPARVTGKLDIFPPYTLFVPLEDGRRVRIDWR